ncbi:MAG TPA: hypothetical protein VFD00_09275 [Thermoclostridium sp.]|nr:hypothetical protein [Thermoclostridium sp.]
MNKYNEEGFYNFVEEFWNNPSVSMIKLKKKHGIPNTISFSDIVKAYSNSTYIEFLNKCWDPGVGIDEIIREYGINYDKTEKLFFPLTLKVENTFCPNCLENSIFEIVGEINRVKKGIYSFRCSRCFTLCNENELLDETSAELEKQERAKKYNNFVSDMEYIKNKISEVKCPNCQSEDFDLSVWKDEMTYEITCKNCAFRWDNIEQLIEQFENWKQRAAMMIAIRAREKSLIEEKLKDKSIENINFVSEEIVTKERCYGAIAHMIKESGKGEHEWWCDVFNRIRSCNRPELILLIKIAELCGSNLVIWCMNIMKKWLLRHWPLPLIE